MNKKVSTKKVEVKPKSKIKTEVKENTTKKSVEKVVEKTNKKVKNENFYAGAVKELKKVRWPLKKEMLKYSAATLIFIIFFAGFFLLSDIIIAAIKGLV